MTKTVSPFEQKIKSFTEKEEKSLISIEKGSKTPFHSPIPLTQGHANNLNLAGESIITAKNKKGRRQKKRRKKLNTKKKMQWITLSLG